MNRKYEVPVSRFAGSPEDSGEYRAVAAEAPAHGHWWLIVAAVLAVIAIAACLFQFTKG